MAGNGKRNTATVKLSQRGTGIVAAVSGVLVLAAFNGLAVPAAAAGYVLYKAVIQRAAVRAKARKHEVPLRGLCWAVVALATYLAVNGSTAPGGPSFGLSLAVALAVALRLTASRRTA